MSVDRLREILDATGPPTDVREISDMLWLACHLTPAPAEPARPREAAPAAPPEASETPPPTPGRPRPPRPRTPVHPPPAAPDASPDPEPAGVDVLVPTAPMLTDPRALQRALRPLKRRVPARGRWRLDERATAARIADTGVWVPVLAAERERWLGLDLVVDTGPAMRIWRPLAEELTEMLLRQGAFTDVRVHYLDESGSLAGSLSPRTLVDPSGRRAVLVLSDCSGPHWWDGRAGKALRRERDLPPDERVRRFLSVASPTACELAAHVAVSVPSLPVMRLIHQTLDDTAGPGPLAEVLLSGLLRPLPGSPERYEFVPGTRQALLDTLPRPEGVQTLRTLEMVSTQIERRATTTSPRFPAVIPLAEGSTAGRRAMTLGWGPFALVNPEARRLLFPPDLHPATDTDLAAASPDTPPPPPESLPGFSAQRSFPAGHSRPDTDEPVPARWIGVLDVSAPDSDGAELTVRLARQLVRDGRSPLLIADARVSHPPVLERLGLRPSGTLEEVAEGRHPDLTERLLGDEVDAWLLPPARDRPSDDLLLRALDRAAPAFRTVLVRVDPWDLDRVGYVDQMVLVISGTDEPLRWRSVFSELEFQGLPPPVLVVAGPPVWTIVARTWTFFDTRSSVGGRTGPDADFPGFPPWSRRTSRLVRRICCAGSPPKGPRWGSTW